QELGLVHRQRIARAEALFGEVRDRILEVARAFAEAQQLLAQAAVDAVRIPDPRAQAFDVALALVGAARELVDARGKLFAQRGLRIGLAALQRLHAPQRVGAGRD